MFNIINIINTLKIRDQTGPLQVRDSWCCWGQLCYATKTQLKAPKAPNWTHFLPFAVSLWHKSAYNRFFLCMEATLNIVNLGPQVQHSGSDQIRPKTPTYLVRSTMCLLIFVFGWSLSSISQFRANLEFLLEVTVLEVRSTVSTTTIAVLPHLRRNTKLEDQSSTHL